MPQFHVPSVRLRKLFYEVLPQSEIAALTSAHLRCSSKAKPASVAGERVHRFAFGYPRQAPFENGGLTIVKAIDRGPGCS